MVMNKVCKFCGKSPEDTKEKFLFVIVDDRKIETCICVNCALNRP